MRLPPAGFCDTLMDGHRIIGRGDADHALIPGGMRIGWEGVANDMRAVPATIDQRLMMGFGFLQ